LVKTIREDAGKKEKPTFGMIDAKSIKNADTAEEKGYDAHKKGSEIKLYIVRDAMGPPHASSVFRVNITDREGAVKMASSHIKSFLCMKKVYSRYVKPHFDTIAFKKICEKRLK